MRSTIPADSTPRSAISAPPNTRIATPSKLSKPPPKTVHHQGRTPERVRARSAHLPTTDTAARRLHVRFVPIGDISPGPALRRGWHFRLIGFPLDCGLERLWCK